MYKYLIAFALIACASTLVAKPRIGGGTCTKKQNTDVQGADLSSVSGQPESACCGICGGTSGCQAYAWNNFNGGTCWLKTATGPLISNNGVTTGILSGSSCTQYSNSDIQGNDLSSVSGQSESACCGICSGTAGCQAYAFSNYQGGTCWLKSGTGPIISNPGVNVGVTGGGGSTTWSVLKSFDLSSIDKVANDWQIIQWNPGNVNNELQAYIKDSSTLFVRNGALVLRAYRNSGKYYSARLHSNMRITPTSAPGRKLRVEYTAKVPTAMGAWPALWMLGIDGVYGGWPQQGEIDVMEWVWSIQNDIKSSLHWFSGTDWSTDFQVTMQDISNTPLTYGVEYSAVPNNEYIQFYIKKADGSVSYGNRATPSTWHDQSKPWRPSPACSGYTPGASRCSPLAPFDNQMYLILNLAVGGDWGGVGVNNYNAFDAGVEMTVSAVTIYQAQ